MSRLWHALSKTPSSGVATLEEAITLGRAVGLGQRPFE